MKPSKPVNYKDIAIGIGVGIGSWLLLVLAYDTNYIKTPRGVLFGNLIFEMFLLPFYIVIGGYGGLLASRAKNHKKSIERALLFAVLTQLVNLYFIYSLHNAPIVGY